jgi:hypothetical protein
MAKQSSDSLAAELRDAMIASFERSAIELRDAMIANLERSAINLRELLLTSNMAVCLKAANTFTKS